jgi:tryptophan 7-halogenase
MCDVKAALYFMENNPIKHVCIVGGGTAGWMTAVALSRLMGTQRISITLVESESIGTVGVGEATFPHIRAFNARIGIDEVEFMARTKASFKLGIEFRNWGRLGDSYIHAFGKLGEEIGGVAFHHHWAKLFARGQAEPIERYSLPASAARSNRFARPSMRDDSQADYSYAFQFDAALYAAYLRNLSEESGVKRYEGKVTSVHQNAETGFVETISMDNGQTVSADLFVDCSGFLGLLIEDTLKTGYEDWSHWLPCDRAVAVPCSTHGPLTPYTRATARDAGWMWRIPLQHRVGNGHVYCSGYISDEDAAKALVDQLESPPLADPKFLSFKTGRRRKQWSKNVVAIGLSAGFLEPLESTSINLIQLAIGRLLDFFPDKSWNPVFESEFNRLMDMEYERVRDFLILHYHATERDDTPFWNYVRTMAIPDSLTEKMDSYRKRGIIMSQRDGMFHEASWVAVYSGQNIVPRGYDPRTDFVSNEDVARALTHLKNQSAARANGLPLHEDYIVQIGANGH